MFSAFFPKIVQFMRKCGKYGTARQVTDDNITRHRKDTNYYCKNTDKLSQYLVVIIVNSSTKYFAA